SSALSTSFGGTSRSSPLGETTFAVLTPFLVVTTTFFTLGLFRNVRVSVFTPFASTIVMTSELSGASRVDAVASVVVAVFAFVVGSFVLLQPAANAPNKTIIKMQRFSLILLPPPV